MDQNHDHMLYCSWVMVCDGCNCYFSFSAIFCSLTPLTAQKIKIKKKKKNEKHAWRNHHFTYVYQKLWSDDVQFLRYCAWRTDGRTDRQMDGQMEKVTYRGGYPTSKLRITSQKTVRDHSFIKFIKFSKKLNVRIRE